MGAFKRSFGKRMTRRMCHQHHNRCIQRRSIGHSGIIRCIYQISHLTIYKALIYKVQYARYFSKIDPYLRCNCH
ncbi:hypothetical protein ENHY17A_100348 [Moraxellaceae bacterium 17A]|nr:hypothetical protein ENHY17A_100348 [Moraxellaceae bacterium 17A]